MKIEVLNDWLSKDRSNGVKLALFLGYKTSATIEQWVRRGQIPGHQVDLVTRFVKGKK